MGRAKRTASTLLILATLLTSACSMLCSKPPATFQDADLVGTWEADYRKYRNHGGPWTAITSIEVLIFRSDGTYQQLYDDGEGTRYISAWNKWWVERFPDGAVRVHLNGGRFYPSEIHYGVGDIIHNYNDDGSGHPLRLSNTEVVLIVKSSFGESHHVYLEYPPVGDPDSPIIVEFFREEGR